MKASLTKVKIMGCPCYAVSEDTIEEQILHFIDNDICGYSVAINAEKIKKYKEDEQLKNIIDESIYPYPDGAGAVLGIKWLFGLRSEKINMPIRALEVANKNSLKVFVIGAKEDVHSEGLEIIKTRYPNIAIVGSMHGYHDESDIISAVVEACPQIIMLAMGSPRQEKFAHKLINVTQTGFAIGCGGALDIIAGRLKRAPEFWINNNIEWLYRLIQEPWRWKRQLFLPVFYVKLLNERVKSCLKRL